MQNTSLILALAATLLAAACSDDPDAETNTNNATANNTTANNTTANNTTANNTTANNTTANNTTANNTTANNTTANNTTANNTTACAPTDALGAAIDVLDPFTRQTISVGPDPEEFISYVDEGSGDPVVFIHGAPTYSYLWRNVIPHVSDTHRAIAIDLVGYGDSGSPAGAQFRYPEHQQWFASFVDALNLDNITLVVHDIGSVVGFDFAANNPDKVKAIVHLESVYFPLPNADLLPPEAAFIMTDEGQQAIVDDNWFIETMMPSMMQRQICDAEKASYAAPWEDVARRRALQIVPLDLPIAGMPADNQASFEAFGTYLGTSDVPKLLIYADPGVLVQDVVAPGFPASVRDIVSGFPNTTAVGIGSGLHFLQEDDPHGVGRAISDFLGSLP